MLSKLKAHAERVSEVAEYSTDETRTKSYLVEPLLEILGYNCRDPRDVEFEYTADVAGRKGEKVDYALMREGKPVVLVEAKGRGSPLGKGEIEQLQRYFPHEPSAKIAVLTDGVRWHWFKGRSEQDVAHLMETTPFLIYDSRDPSATASEWLTHITKSEFNFDNLIRVARRLEFADKVYSWIQDTLIKPNDLSVVRLSRLMGIGATDEEIPLLVDAIGVAMRRVIDNQSEAPITDGLAESTESKSQLDHGSEMGIVYLKSDEPTGSIDADSSGNRSPRFDGNLRYYAHYGDFLDLGDGRVLDATKRARAWRMASETWTVETSGIAVVNAVLAELISCEDEREDLEALAAYHKPLFHHEVQPPNSDFRPIPKFSRLYWNSNVTNEQKAIMLSEIADFIRFNPPAVSPLARKPLIEWWLPNKPRALTSIMGHTIGL